jgi:hypothetical protein
MKLATGNHLALRLRMIGSPPLLPLYAVLLRVVANYLLTSFGTGQESLTDVPVAKSWHSIRLQLRFQFRQ